MRQYSLIEPNSGTNSHANADLNTSLDNNTHIVDINQNQ